MDEKRGDKEVRLMNRGTFKQDRECMSKLLGKSVVEKCSTLSKVRKKKVD